MKKLIIMMLGLVILLSTSVLAEDVSIDGFESGGWCGGLNWEDCWTYSPWDTIVTNAAEGTYSAKIGTDRTITRQASTAIDLSQYPTLNLSFYRKTFGFGSAFNDALTVTVTMDGNDVLTETFLNEVDWSQESFLIDNSAGYSTLTVSFYFDYIGGTEAYVDSVKILGEADQASEVIISMDNSYPINTENVEVVLSSTESNILHTLELSKSDGSVFCTRNLQSPAVPQTSFSTTCDMPSETDVDAKAYFYVTNDETINTTEYFNIIELNNNPDLLNIKQVYFSPQVLQGSSTEIFALLETSNTNVSSIKTILTFPDNTTRELSMFETGNYNEYRAFITDTYQVGTVSFRIEVLSDNYVDEYSNIYDVIAYNVDFVELVNQVAEVLSVKQLESQPPGVDVLGTYYEVGDTAKVIAQLSSAGVPINNATCYASIYKPDNSVFALYQLMTRISDEGLYVYDLTIPDSVGVYPLAVTCDYLTSSTEYLVMGAVYNYGTSLGNATDLWYDDDVYSQLLTETVGSQEVIDVELIYNNVVASSAVTDIVIEWQGYTDITGSEGQVWWYNWNNNSWVLSSQTINSELNDITIFFPDGLNFSNFINSSNSTKIKVNGTAPLKDSQTTLLYDDFEDGNQNGWTENVIVSPVDLTNIGIAPTINGSLSAGIDGSDDAGDRGQGALEYYFDTTNLTNISVAYTRLSSGAESSDDFAVQISPDGGSNWYDLESWSGNNAETRQTYNLNSSYDNNSNAGLRFWAEVNYRDDEFAFDDVLIRGFSSSHYNIYTDFITLNIIEASGVVNEIRGGGELNVKDRIADIEDDLDEILANTEEQLETKYEMYYVMPQVYSPQDSTIVTVHLHEAGDHTNGKTGANCKITIFGPANTTGIGPEQISEANMTELGGGLYYYIAPIPPSGWPAGIYTLESNCIDNDGNWYVAEGFRMTNNYLYEINDVDNEVWNFTETNRTVDLELNYTAIGENVNVWDTNTTINPGLLDQFSVEIWGTNHTINPGLIGQFVINIWDYVARYTHGIIN